jgi:predicted N-acyltransferase
MRRVSKIDPYELYLASSITEFSADEWNALAGEEVIPFLEWEWLEALETSGSISPGTGWYPFHLALRKGGTLVAAAPLYVKNHSDGEFIWDYFWAEAAGALDRPWYPKLVGAVPATPALGYCFLCAPGEDASSGILLDAVNELCRANDIRGIHFLFTNPLWARDNMVSRGYSGWEHSRFEWTNDGYASFGDYLLSFTKNQRKNIRKEYERPAKEGIITGIVENPPAFYFSLMYDLYRITNDKFIPWDARWVNEAFFLRLAQTFSRRIVFSQARYSGQEPFALAMMIRKGKKIWGRYWGTYQDVKDLHFALCYYIPIDYCIREGIVSFDPGIGSPHKIRRGFRACFDTSYHHFFDPALDRFFGSNVATVNQHEQNNIALLNSRLPFKDPRE